MTNKEKQAAQLTGTCILALFVFVVLFWGGNVYKNYKGFSSPSSGTGSVAHEAGPVLYTFDDLLDAIEWVESKGDPWAVGDNGNAVGAYQIHEIYFNDVRRIQLKQPATFSWSACIFRLDDRLNRQDSREMVSIYLKHYGGTFEEMARKHNGGPNGHNKPSTKAYWLKVKARMEQK